MIKPENYKHNLILRCVAGCPGRGQQYLVFQLRTLKPGRASGDEVVQLSNRPEHRPKTDSEASGQHYVCPTQQTLHAVPREDPSREKHLSGVMVFLKFPQQLEAPPHAPH